MVVVVAAGAGDGCWLQLLSFLSALMHFTILKLSLTQPTVCGGLFLFINNLEYSSLFLHFVLVFQVRYTRTPRSQFVVLVPHMNNFVPCIDTQWRYFVVLVHTYCMFALLFLFILVLCSTNLQPDTVYMWRCFFKLLKHL